MTEDYRRDRCVEDPLWAADEIARLENHNGRLMNALEDARVPPGRYFVRDNQAVCDGVVYDLEAATNENTCMWMSSVVNRLTNAPAFMLRPVETP